MWGGGTVIPPLPRFVLIRDGIVGDGGTSGQGDRSRFVNDSIGWERGVWDMYKLDSLASRGRLTCSPPPH